ncbi:MAG: hypothetical protein D4R79_03370 [Comamonadaceae bacterium]|nr:MAG: hypothetical protein D4R79_03370 [Comamonadaceae bacterium]
MRSIEYSNSLFEHIFSTGKEFGIAMAGLRTTAKAGNRTVGVTTGPRERETACLIQRDSQLRRVA